MNAWQGEWIDYYEVLGVSKDATEEEIKQSYRNLMKKYHPDIYHEEDAHIKTARLNEAYEWLKDPEKRKEYDQYYEARQRGEEPVESPSEEPINYEEVKRQYDEKEVRQAERLVLKKLIEEKIKDWESILEVKNNLVIQAYGEAFEKEEYYQSAKEWQQIALNFIEEINLLVEKAYQLDLIEEKEKLTEKISLIIPEIEGMPLTITDAVEYVETELLRERLDQRTEQITQFNLEIDSFLKSCGGKEISAKQFKDYVTHFKEIGNTHLQFYQQVSSIITDLEDTPTYQKLKEQCELLEFKLQALPENYQEAIFIGQVQNSILNLTQDRSKILELQATIRRICDILERHNYCNRSEKLYSYGADLLRNSKLFEELKSHCQTAKDVLSGGEFSPTFLTNLSQKAEQLYTNAFAMHQSANKYYEQLERKMVKNSFVNQAKTIKVLTDDIYALWDKSEALRLFHEAEKNRRSLELFLQNNDLETLKELRKSMCDFCDPMKRSLMEELNRSYASLQYHEEKDPEWKKLERSLTSLKSHRVGDAIFSAVTGLCSIFLFFPAFLESLVQGNAENNNAFATILYGFLTGGSGMISVASGYFSHACISKIEEKKEEMEEYKKKISKTKKIV